MSNFKDDFNSVQDYVDNARSCKTQEAFERLERKFREMQTTLNVVYNCLSENNSGGAKFDLDNFFRQHPDLRLEPK